MDGLENIMHSKRGQTKINTMCYHLYVESKIQNKKKKGQQNILTFTENKLMVTSREKKGERGKIRV